MDTGERSKKSGCQNKVQKRKTDLKKAGSDPKQKKLSGFGPSPTTSTVANPSSSKQSKDVPEVKENPSVELVLNIDPSSCVNVLSPDQLQHEVPSEESDATDQHEESTTSKDTPESQKEESSSTSLITAHQEDERIESTIIAEIAHTDFQEISSDYSELSKFIPPSPNSTVSAKLEFLKCHPIQPSSTEIRLPFDGVRVYNRVSKSEDQELSRRKWLSYCDENKHVYCSLCMAFSSDRSSPFIDGLEIVIKHLYNQLEKHEKSKSHSDALHAKYRACGQKDIESMIDKTKGKRKSEVTFRRQVISRVIDIILFIGRQGIAYRGSEEAAYSLENIRVNHGNFLELVLFICKFDPIMKSHVAEAIRLSKERKLKQLNQSQEEASHLSEPRNPKSSKGRGSLLTFLSKSFINKLVILLSDDIQHTIANAVLKAGQYSLEVDSTQDIAVIDQLAICVRYVDSGKVNVKLLKLVAAKKTTGEALYQQVKSELEKLGLSTKRIIGCSFDGAANMSGQYNGLQAKLRQDNEDLLFVHCEAHVLNLVMTDSTESCKTAKDFLGLLNSTAVFISESHKRMTVWCETNKEHAEGHSLLRRLQKVGATRWWSKDRALASVFDDTIVPFEKCTKYITLIECLYTIAHSDDFSADVSYKSSTLLENWTKFKNILLAFVYRKLFNITSPASAYLQGQGINYFTASNIVKRMHTEIISKRNEFGQTYQKAKEFAAYIQGQWVDSGLEVPIELDFPAKRVPTAKRQPDDKSHDEARQALSVPAKEFEVNVYNVIFDSAQNQTSQRFLFNEELLVDIAWLDPTNFTKIKSEKEALPGNALSKLASLTKTDLGILQRELLQFSTHYEDYFPNILSQKPSSSVTSSSQAQEQESGEDTQRQFDEEIESYERMISNVEKCDTNIRCKKCLVCTLALLSELVTEGSMYDSLYTAYKFVLTLSCTQVSCERVFSILKIIKNRLRSSLGQELLESFMLFYVNRDFVFDYEKIIDRIADSSMELARCLKL